MCGCNKGNAATAKRYEVVDKDGKTLGTHATHPDALAQKRKNPGATIKVQTATAKSV